MKTLNIAKINEVNITVVTDSDRNKLIPIKPICEALGIVTDTQKRKIEDDEILSSVTTLRVATGADGKQYEMFCIPYKYVFGWLFTINPKNVSPEARESVAKYRKICYEVLFKHFEETAEFAEQKQNKVISLMESQKIIRADFNDAKNKLKLNQAELDKAAKMNIDEWREANGQYPIPYKEQTIEE